MTFRQFVRAVFVPRRQPLTRGEFWCAALPRPWMWPVLVVALAWGAWQGLKGRRAA